MPNRQPKAATENVEKNIGDTAENTPVPEEETTLPPPEEKEIEKSISKGGISVYLGPSIKAVIQSGTVYAASKEAALKQLSAEIEKYPLIASLIVTGEELSECRTKIKTPGNLLHSNYRKLAGILKNT